MSITSDIVGSPEEWSGARIVQELPLRMYDEGDRRRDPGLPAWLRDVMVICDFETHVLMEGLLGWWENRSTVDLDLVAAALRAVGMPGQADLLDEGATILGRGEVDIGTSHDLPSVSTFNERHPGVTKQQLDRFGAIERRLWLNDAAGPDINPLLIAHASAGLATLKPSS